jgi:hypothetical protein
LTLVENILGKKIIDILRIDRQRDYEFYSPIALIIHLDQLDERLILTATSKGKSCDIRMLTDCEIKEEFRLEFGEALLNELKAEDELNRFQNQNIIDLKIAEFIKSEILGDGFIMPQGKIAGIELKTERNKILFWNNHGAWIDIDDDVMEIPNPKRWQWT